MTKSIQFWIKFSLLNLFIVALIGLLMRYKIGFEFPYLNQKNLQHAHSHFAFAGWISHSLMCFMLYFLDKNNILKYQKTYRRIIISNLLCSYGMLIFFTLQGYSTISILLSTLSIFIAYVFAYVFWKNLKISEFNTVVKNWFKAGLVFNVLSSLGTFYLAYMMASKNIHEKEYLASIYFYLHFQYNGWFSFIILGLFHDYFKLNQQKYMKIFQMFFLACIPTYFLSTLWLELPVWLYCLTIAGAVIQTYAWFKFVFLFTQEKRNDLLQIPFFLKYILLFIGFAMSVKLLLQLGSTIPTVSKLAFGFRPIVIAYLHLVLLAIISLSILFYGYSTQLIRNSKVIKFGILFFTVGVIVNELILAVQGIASFSYTLIPYVDKMLFGAAIILITGIGITAFFSFKEE
ncbi:hypothetical protein [Flavobacterium sp. H122]|uniref:hypothetical protein n=1 Tax=Flavobacterium sp. H122 TaxID=2529860 RepID=UPI0010AA9E1F|nr:hypothetical protein [Flavobacterium sp. H122]